ncbi:metallophosphoesterase [uncultured Microscilla sp.]|uniref:metallophosphoesterase family protein n=1 Tax=uncultured Microscilla sp. TaxID=432653 RepID=UPI00260A1BC5|nr:metallophosphoesterase [uncultured Microscilla sp.]
MLNLRRFISTLVFFITLSGNLFAQQTTKTEFSFVILGDSQFNTPALFNKIVNEVAQLSPAFVIQVGDLIKGKLQGKDTTLKQWARFKDQLLPLGNTPYYPVPGNHDVLDKKGNPLPYYKQYWGKTNYSFDYKNAHFTILNSNDGKEAQIGKAQIKWLEKDLRKAQNKAHRMVFFHHPIYTLKNHEQLHTLFVKYKVKNVFYGHRHHYEYQERDGIQYVMTNATGKSGTHELRSGTFPHFLLATVRDGKFSYAIIKAGSVLPPTMVYPRDNENFLLYYYLFKPKFAHFSQLKKTPEGYEVSFHMNNFTSQDLHFYLQWDNPDGRWEMSPHKATQVFLKKKTKGYPVKFVLKRIDQSRPEGKYPTCTVKTMFKTSNGAWLTPTHQFEIK